MILLTRQLCSTSVFRCHLMGWILTRWRMSKGECSGGEGKPGNICLKEPAVFDL